MNDPSAGPGLRDAGRQDIPALARLHVRAFDQTHGRGPAVEVRERQWRAKFASPGRLLFCIVLEELTGELVGFASGEPHTGHELSTYRGVLDKIYLLHEYHGRGLGRVLLCASTQRFLASGVNSMLLFGDARSPANGFYEAMGGERLYAGNGQFHGGYGWRDLRVLEAACSRRRARSS